MDKQKILIAVLNISILGGVVFFLLFQNKTELPFELRESNNSMNSNSENNNEKCVITVRGDKYDVTEFRNKHKGGNIFKCGEDMTDAFNKQHGDKQFRDLQKYKVN